MAASSTEGHSWEGVSVSAEWYERRLVPVLFQPWADVLVDIADVQLGDRVLDLACGTGVVARAAARRAMPDGYVCGLDVNDDMLAIARRLSGDMNIEWRRAAAEATGLPDSFFDVAVCQQGLQFFPDRIAALRETRRVLRSRGCVVLATWCATDEGDSGYRPIAEALQRHIPDDASPLAFIAAIFGLSDGREVGRLAKEAGFEAVTVERRTAIVRFSSAEAWVEAFLGAAPVPSIATLAPATRSALIADAAAGLQGYVDSTGIAFPLHTNIALCRAQSKR